MSMFLVSQECRDLGLRVGAIHLHNICVTEATAELRGEIDNEIRRIHTRYSSRGEIRAVAELARHHEILRQVGVKPRSHPPSTQKLMELALKRGTLPQVNNLVDAYNLISLRTLCSLGAHDVDRFAPPIELRLFRGDETFRPLGSQEDSAIARGEFGYVAGDDQVVCRLDCLQADHRKITAETNQALLIIEATTIQQPEELESVFAETIDVVTKHCGGTAEIVCMPY